MAIKLPFSPPRVNLGKRTRKILVWVGYVFFALFTFVFALQLSFPYSRVKDKLVDSASDKYTITVSKVERGLIPGRVYFKGVTITTNKTKPEDVVETFYINELQLDVGILAMMGGHVTLDFDATIGDKKEGFGHLKGDVSVAKFGKGDITASIQGNSLPSAALPMHTLIGLPMSGKLQFGVNLNLPMEKSKMGKTSINWQRVTGAISLDCPKGCTFGDGKTKLKPLLKNRTNQVMVGEGIDFGKVTLDKLVARVSIKRGVLKVDKFDAPSKDGEVHVDYEMKLEKNFDESMVTGCLRFKGSDDLLKREPKTHAALSTTGAELRSDGLFHIRLTDRFKDMKRLNQECGPNGQVGPANGDNSPTGGPVRPNLTVQPEEAAKPNTGTMAPPPSTAPLTPEVPATPPSPPPVGTQGSAAGSANPTGAPPPTPAPGAREEMKDGHVEHFENGRPEGKAEGSAAAPTPTPTPPSE